MTKTIRRLTPRLGAEVQGLKLDALTALDAEWLREQFAEHHVLVIRDASRTDEQLVEFGQVFGPIENARRQSSLASRPDIMVITNRRDTAGEAMGSLPDGELYWHYDRIHQAIPNKAGILHAIQLPTAGGETRFANTCAAYDALPETMKVRLEGLTALNTYQYGQTRAADKQLTDDSPQAVHPVVRTLPDSGHRALYVCRLMTDRILELPENESRELLETLFDHCEQEEFVYEHAWAPNDVLIWDNRCVLHARNDFDPREDRLLKRVTVGDTQRPNR